MDVRGIEVTNQLRSAIRAKLLELGVRYDEELPDYILVMVVNKKTRQQMHEDLNLFLEDSTTPFVDWLHDQVLKKLQKVTVVKQKKAQREFVPAVVVKQEEEKRKKKIGDEVKVKNDPDGELTAATPPPVVSPAPKSPSLSPRPRLGSENSKAKVDEENEGVLEPEKLIQVPPVVKDKVENVKRSIEDDSQRPDKRLKSADSKDPEIDESEGKKLKSCVNKPRITSVVSVKTRLGLARNKFEVHRNERERIEAGRSEADRRQADKRADRRLYEPRRDSRGRDDKRSRSREEKNRVVLDKRPKEDRERERERERRTDRAERTIKDRLGQLKPGGKFKDKPDEPRNVRSRLGPVNSKFIALGRLGVKVREDDKEEEDDDDEEEEVVGPVRSRIIAVNNVDKLERKDGDKDGEEEEEDKDKDKVIASKVIVTPRPLKPLQPAQKRATQSLLLRAVAEANQSVVKQKNPEPALLDKKPILKRLQPINMRTSGQNFSVHLNATKRLVMEKIQVELTTSDSNRTEPEPYIPRAVTDEQMGVVMSLFKRGNDNQKFLVTLNGYNNNVNKEDSYSEDDGLEMEVNEDDELILNNSQSESFITNSGISLESEEIDDPIDTTDSNIANIENPELDNLNTTEEVETIEPVDDQEKIETCENNENECTDNINNLINEVTPPKRRKLSPIVYTRSPSPEKAKTVLSTVTAVDKKSPVATILPDKSRDKCRYWPNCTLGNKCAFMHPPVPCSAFPACKFGDKCAYKHPKCKFGLSCTKLGCVFSHPSQQCKYHPFCTKPGCMYLHPQTVPAPVVIPAAATAPAPPLESVRAKFTWRRRD